MAIARTAVLTALLRYRIEISMHICYIYRLCRLCAYYPRLWCPPPMAAQCGTTHPTVSVRTAAAAIHMGRDFGASPTAARTSAAAAAAAAAGRRPASAAPPAQTATTAGQRRRCPRWMGGVPEGRLAGSVAGVAAPSVGGALRHTHTHTPPHICHYMYGWCIALYDRTNTALLPTQPPARPAYRHPRPMRSMAAESTMSA